MTFLIQFVRTRRGARVVIRTVRVEAEDSRAALSYITDGMGTSRWPVNTDAVRVMDDGGRTLLDWSVPAPDHQPSVPSPNVAAEARIAKTTSLAGRSLPDDPATAVDPAHADHPGLEVGQAISYAEDGSPEIWKGGYEIVAGSESNAGEAQYTIRSADDSHDRIVKAHELREDLGARTRGL
jgi:hypothetical protein